MEQLLFTPKDVARRMRLSRWRVHREMASGRLPFLRIRRYVCIGVYLPVGHYPNHHRSHRRLRRAARHA